MQYPGAIYGLAPKIFTPAPIRSPDPPILKMRLTSTNSQDRNDSAMLRVDAPEGGENVADYVAFIETGF